MLRWPRWLCMVALSLSLVACASRGVVMTEGDALARQLGHEQTVRGQTVWGFQGRIAIAMGEEGGQARVVWSQGAEGSDIDIDAPLGAGRWRLQPVPEGYRLSGGQGRVIEGPDAAALLAEATGMRLPLQAMPFWVRGARQDAQAALRFAPDGRLSEILEQEWRIVYERWDAQGRPQRLTATRELDGKPLRLRLLIERWEP